MTHLPSSLRCGISTPVGTACQAFEIQGLEEAGALDLDAVGQYGQKSGSAPSRVSIRASVLLRAGVASDAAAVLIQLEAYLTPPARLDVGHGGSHLRGRRVASSSGPKRRVRRRPQTAASPSSLPWERRFDLVAFSGYR